MSMDATKYKPYPAYKESGVEWLGDVPEHWEVAPIKRSFDVRLGKMLQTEASSPADELCHYLRAANIQWFGVDASDIKQMWFSPKERRELALVNGDLLVSEGGDVGRSTIWHGEIDNCYFQNSVNRVRSRDKNSTHFLCYWISAIKDMGYIDVLCNKSTIAHFTAEKVQAVPTPLPPTAEQYTIAAFLDRETAKIDTLTAKQERLIELLQEKRTALISHAVTKGLNPDAPMKDSGVEWLGEVPEHWLLVVFRRILARPIINGIFKKKEDFGTGTLLINVFDIYNKDFLVQEMRLDRVNCNTQEIASYEACPGDLFFVRSSLKMEGIAAVSMLDKVNEPTVFECHIIRARPDHTRVSSRYSVYFLNSQGIRGKMIAGSKVTTMTTIDQETILSTPFLLPPWEEQLAIANYLDSETTKIDALITKARRAIDLLKERRTALISAAVTGKIDVREAFPSVTPE